MRRSAVDDNRRLAASGRASWESGATSIGRAALSMGRLGDRRATRGARLAALGRAFSLQAIFRADGRGSGPGRLGGLAATVLGDISVLGEDGNRLRSGSRGGGVLQGAGNGLRDDFDVLDGAVRDIGRARRNCNQGSASRGASGSELWCRSHLGSRRGVHGIGHAHVHIRSLPSLNFGVVIRGALVQVVNLLGEILASRRRLSTALPSIGLVIHARDGALHRVNLIILDSNVRVPEVAVASIAKGGIVCVLLAAGSLALGRGEGLRDTSLGAKDARSRFDTTDILPARDGESRLRDSSGSQEAANDGGFGHFVRLGRGAF